MHGVRTVEQFIGEQIEVEQSPTSPRPLRFRWRGRLHPIVEILHRRVDVGFGDLPARSRKWYTRRHRRYYTVRDAAGEVFEIYIDYSIRTRKTWWLVRRLN
jgi:hypothetical protein